MGLVIVIILILVLGGVVEDVYHTILDFSKEHELLFILLVALVVLFLLYLILPKKCYVCYLGTTIHSRKVGRRSASASVSPNYDGSSYSVSYDPGDPGDWVYEVCDVYEFPSGARKEFHVRSSLNEEERIDTVQYGVLVYSLFFHFFKPTVNAYDKFIKEEKQIEPRKKFISKPFNSISEFYSKNAYVIHNSLIILLTVLAIFVFGDNISIFVFGYNISLFFLILPLLNYVFLIPIIVAKESEIPRSIKRKSKFFKQKTLFYLAYMSMFAFAYLKWDTPYILIIPAAIETIAYIIYWVKRWWENL